MALTKQILWSEGPPCIKELEMKWNEIKNEEYQTTFVFFFFALDGLINPDDASDAVPNDDASPPCTGAIKLDPVFVVVVVVPLLLGSWVVVGVSDGGVWTGVAVVEPEVVLFLEMLRILTIFDSGLIEGGIAAKTGSVTSWSCFTIKARSTICKSWNIFLQRVCTTHTIILSIFLTQCYKVTNVNHLNITNFREYQTKKFS